MDEASMMTFCTLIAEQEVAKENLIPPESSESQDLRSRESAKCYETFLGDVSLFCRNLSSMVGIASILEKSEHFSVSSFVSKLDSEHRHRFLESLTMEYCLDLISQVLGHVVLKFDEGGPKLFMELGMTIVSNLAYQLECHFECKHEAVDNILKEFFYRLSSRGLVDPMEGLKALEFLTEIIPNRYLRMQLIDVMIFCVMEGLDVIPEDGASDAKFQYLAHFLKQGGMHVNLLLNDLFPVQTIESRGKAPKMISEESTFWTFSKMRRHEKIGLKQNLEMWTESLSECTVGLSLFRRDFCSEVYILQSEIANILARIEAPLQI